MKAIFHRHDIANVLSPANEAAVKLVQGLKPGEGVTVEVKKVRSLRQLRLWWAFCDTVGKSIGVPAEAISDFALVGTGHVDVYSIGGATMQRAKSIAFGNMTQDEFNDLFDAGRAHVLETVAPHMKREDLARVEAMVI